MANCIRLLILQTLCFVCHEAKDVADTYKKLIPCLLDSRHTSASVNLPQLAFPVDADKHYRELMNATRPFRNVLPHEGPSDYRGPWIENHFIEHFMIRNLSYFNGFFPLFIQWTDIHVADICRNEPYYNTTKITPLIEMQESLMAFLRPDVMYLAVCQDDQGIFQKLMKHRPNILVLSAGGFGHIPIPLIKGELAHAQIPAIFHWDVGFFGNLRPRLSRSSMLSQIESEISKTNLKYKIGPSNDWLQFIHKSKFNLAPRGYGRTSYRLAEIIQVGRIPVYMYDDYPWLPYQGTNLDFSNYGFSAKMGSMKEVVSDMVNISHSNFTTMMKSLYEVRVHYTYNGVLKQIEKFIKDPLGPNGGQLRCTKVPNIEH